MLEAVLQQEGMLSDEVAAELSMVRALPACVSLPSLPLTFMLDRA